MQQAIFAPSKAPRPLPRRQLRHPLQLLPLRGLWGGWEVLCPASLWSPMERDKEIGKAPPPPSTQPEPSLAPLTGRAVPMEDVDSDGEVEPSFSSTMKRSRPEERPSGPGKNRTSGNPSSPKTRYKEVQQAKDGEEEGERTGEQTLTRGGRSSSRSTDTDKLSTQPETLRQRASPQMETRTPTKHWTFPHERDCMTHSRWRLNLPPPPPEEEEPFEPGPGEDLQQKLREDLYAAATRAILPFGRRKAMGVVQQAFNAVDAHLSRTQFGRFRFHKLYASVDRMLLGEGETLGGEGEVEEEDDESAASGSAGGEEEEEAAEEILGVPSDSFLVRLAMYFWRVLFLLGASVLIYPYVRQVAIWMGLHSESGNQGHAEGTEGHAEGAQGQEGDQAPQEGVKESLRLVEVATLPVDVAKND
uniref:Uncharacterized protein n=1 Tax=Chromera velia CCMP2878 TaxID=1169474 RepID=A0A0G4I148_9ALVE|eukprot:Cvel_38.t1-p1 / transcript=Cvel_38.t1 / gene=Cvel_38 / organism=Chromera_velia_CCMP2878 / gene_product=hypothetical protein / transcript_product=hypothetical protein / location=Cvel_scaffold5:218420-221907(+) / protein_length=415 / sequence_SO=supercontig / SO=protein_coding / is_pseudo=false